MNKAALRGFAAGILLTTAVFAGFFYGTGMDKEPVPTIKEAKMKLVAAGYTLSKQPVKEENKKPAEDKAKPEQNKPKPSVHSYTLTIKANMTSSEIAKTLYEQKIIDDAGRFEEYLEDQGFASKIQIGKFIVTDNMSDRQLANTLTH